MIDNKPGTKEGNILIIFRLKFHLDPYLKHEEGLAVINQTLPSALRTKGKPYLYMAALHYISSILSSQMSFAELYH